MYTFKHYSMDIKIFLCNFLKTSFFSRELLFLDAIIGRPCWIDQRANKVVPGIYGKHGKICTFMYTTKYDIKKTKQLC